MTINICISSKSSFSVNAEIIMLLYWIQRRDDHRANKWSVIFTLLCSSCLVPPCTHQTGVWSSGTGQFLFFPVILTVPVLLEESFPRFPLSVTWSDLFFRCCFFSLQIFCCWRNLCFCLSFFSSAIPNGFIALKCQRKNFMSICCGYTLYLLVEFL